MNTNPNESFAGSLRNLAQVQKRIGDQTFLKEHLKKNTSAHAIADFLYRCEEVYLTSSVSFVSEETGIDYQEVLHFFRLLDEREFGSFIVGRKGNDSRIKWKFNHISIGGFLLGKLSELKKPPPDSVDYDGGSQPSDKIAHSFHLRPDFQLDITLPADFNQRDLSRLCKWLDTIPFD